jgi:hypothetical protein
MKEPFEEIRITDLDVDLTQPSQEAPGFLRLYLKLSQEPPPDWVKIFEQERRFPPHRTWRNAWVVGAHIVIECVPDELEQCQLNHLKEDVATVNRKFSECAATKKAEIRQQLQEHAQARRDLENLRTRLRFD